MLKLHLGCGRKYLEGYVNIDFEQSEQTVQQDLIADVYSDIYKLDYPANSVSEIRLHHVFEHFPRPVALALLCRWRDWLKPEGRLRIETPDVRACFVQMLNPFTSFEMKQQVMRQIFGSHEAEWAFHTDGWYSEKFKRVFTALGFSNLKIVKTKWEILRNVEVTASKSNELFDTSRYERSVEKLLTMSAISFKQNEIYQVAESEKEMITVWMDAWRDLYESRS